MNQAVREVGTRAGGMHDITGQVRRVVDGAVVDGGPWHRFLRHTSASHTIQENADADVRDDLLGWSERVAPDGDPPCRHPAEERQGKLLHPAREAPRALRSWEAPVRRAITSTSLSVRVSAGQLALGTRQGIFLLEHRTRPRRRRVVVTVQG